MSRPTSSPPAPAPGEAPKKTSSGLRSVGVVGGATVLSRILGLVRDIVFARLFSRAATDAFAIAFTIPNILRRLLAEGIISTAFIPVFSGVEKEEAEQRRNTYGAVLGTFALILVCVTVVGMLLSPWITKLFAPGFTGKRLVLAIYLTRLMFPFLLLVGLASFWIAILQTQKHFAAPALGPVCLNIGIISCALGLHGFFPGSKQITAMAIGVLVGGLLQLILQIVALAKRGLWVMPRWQPAHPAIKEILTLMAPTLLGLGVYQLNMLISRQLASLLPKGSVSYLYYSDRLMELPLGVIAVAFATVNLPTLARQAEDDDWASFRGTLLSGLRYVLFFCIPAAWGLFALREPVIATLFQGGHFKYQAVLATAHVLAPASFGLIFIAMLRNLTPGFYAYKDTRTPVKIAFASLLVNAALSGLFAFLLGLGAAGLTLANGCSALFSVLLAMWLLNKRLTYPQEELTQLLRFFVQLVLFGGVMGGALIWGNSYLSWRTMGTLMRLFWLGTLIASGSLVYFVLVMLFKIPEGQTFLGRFARLAQRFRR